MATGEKKSSLFPWHIQFLLEQIRINCKDEENAWSEGSLLGHSLEIFLMAKEKVQENEKGVVSNK